MSAPARLEVVAGNAAGTWLDVGDELLLGRHADGIGRLGDDGDLSRYHARLSVDPDGSCAIEDLGSTNGTLVNGLRITVPQQLSAGDTVKLGGTTLVVRELPMPATAPQSPPAAQSDEPVVRSIPAASPTRGPYSADDAVRGREPVVQTAQPVADVAAQAAPDVAAASGEPAPPPPLSLRLEVDIAGAEARIFLGTAEEPVRVVFDAGSWRIAPTA
jgi:hypothetical protein